MKSILSVCLLALLALTTGGSRADAHAAHTKHNMILFGDDKIYASHLVYKDPHHYQVILELTIEGPAKQAYLTARKHNPEALFLYLMGPLELEKLKEATALTGPVTFQSSTGQKQEVLANLRVEQKDFKIIFFQKLPLSLEADHGK